MPTGSGGSASKVMGVGGVEVKQGHAVPEDGSTVLSGNEYVVCVYAKLSAVERGVSQTYSRQESGAAHSRIWTSIMITKSCPPVTVTV